MEGDNSLLTLYSEVQTKQVKWVWFPYIASGKLTLLQGDPGDGKSTMMMHIIAELSTGGALPDGTALGKPQRVIYQCSEDGVGDTIKPRLVKIGANCKNVAFINEEIHGNLTLDDERIRDAIISFEPKLLVIDPVQAYIGSDSDLQSAGRARRLMRRLGMWAEAYDCAIVLIGHMNKREGSKGLYRGLGSIDLVAAARSVLQVERDPNDDNIRIVTQIKNSLEATGSDIRFEIRPHTGFKWLGCAEKPLSKHLSQGQVDSGKGAFDNIEALVTKKEKAAYILSGLLKEKDMTSRVIMAELSKYEISEKSARAAKEELGIRAYRKEGVWYWSLKKETGENGRKSEKRTVANRPLSNRPSEGEQPESGSLL